MLPELYLGAAALVILIILLASLFRRGKVRRNASRPDKDFEHLAAQLGRIADALEKLVIHFGASSPRVEQPSAPPQKSSDQTPQIESAKQPEQPTKPAEPRVTLSMFGR
jgi:hypothetical protein